jgi:peptide deformylase
VAEKAGQIITDEDEHAEDGEQDAESQARRQMALAQIRQYPDSALRLRARELPEVDDDVRRLAARMIELMHDAHGVGLAATQVGTLRRIFVLQAGDEQEATAVVNPRLVDPSAETATEDEGCLSLPGVLVPVERPVRVTLEGLALDGSGLRLELEGLPARVAQHEADHLDGVLIIDRTDPESRKKALATLRPQPILVPR